jgi:tetratricopeptide (TPR) repeat protein
VLVASPGGSVPRRRVGALVQHCNLNPRPGDRRLRSTKSSVFVVTCGTVIATWKWAIREAVDYLPHVQGAFFALKRNIEAERLLKRALRIARKTHSHPSLASMLHNLGVVYQARGNYAKAEPLLRRALGERERAFGPDHPEVVNSLNNLGVVYRKRHRFAQAERSLQRALVITERILDPEHPFVAASLDRLGFLYEDLHRYERAETLFSRSLAIREKAFGPDHPKSQLRSIISRGSRSCGRTV